MNDTCIVFGQDRLDQNLVGLGLVQYIIVFPVLESLAIASRSYGLAVC